MSQRRCCNLCAGRLINYRRALKCNDCHHEFHYKCQNLSKTDAEILLNSEYQNYWTCLDCTNDIFPFMKDDIAIPTKINIIDKTKSTKCHCCQRILDKKYSKCNTCDNLVHSRCYAGHMGCKNCARETFPGFD